MKYQIDRLTTFWTSEVLRKVMHNISMTYSKIWHNLIPCFAKFFIAQNVNDGFNWYLPLLIFTYWILNILSRQKNQKKFNQFYYTLLINTFTDDKRKTLPHKIMVRWLIKISLISSKFWLYHTQHWKISTKFIKNIKSNHKFTKQGTELCWI